MVENHQEVSSSKNDSMDNHTSSEIPPPSSQMNSEESFSIISISTIETVAIVDSKGLQQGNDTFLQDDLAESTNSTNSSIP